jgi:nucleoid-associated protein YejK
MERHAASVGGYLVFAEYDHADEIYLAVVLLTSKSRAQFDDALNLSEVVTLDVEHVRHAARFRYSGVADNEPGTVYFVARASEGKFFREFIDCDPVSDSKIQSSRLRTTINEWISTNGFNENQKEEIYKKTFSYWSGCRRENFPMTLEGLANSVYPNDPDPFRNFLSQENTLLMGEFTPPNPSDMRQFQKFAFNGSGLKLEFDRSEWLPRIAVRNGTLTIRRAPQELLQMLENEE